MPLADPRDIGREQAYGYSPSGPGPYAPQVQRQVPDLQPYYPHRYTSPPQGTSHVWGSGGYGDSPSGPYGQHFAPGGLATGPRYQTPQEPSLGNLLRSIQTTDPGAGYGQSPSGPTAQMPARQPQVQRQVPDLQEAPGYTINRTPWRGAGSDSPTSPYAKAPTYADRYSVQTDPRRLASGAAIRGADYGRSPSNPNWQPARTPKPMSPLYEGPPLSSPSNPNWRPPGG